MDIYYDNLPVAHVDDRLEFAYHPDWLSRSGSFPISLSMPLSTEHVGPETILPWLANLLPEAHLSEIGQQIGVSPQDILGILREIGRDTAGALAIGQPRQERDQFRPVETEADLERIVEELPSKPFLIGEEGVSMSLAGAQDKLPVALIDGRVAIPLNGTPSTHILKPDIKRLNGSVQNEAFCMTLAGLVGLDVAKVTTGRAGARTYLLVERYDRMISDRGVRRIHQEDFCQVLGIFPKDKYEFDAEGRRRGPGLRQIFNAVARHVSPGARLGLLDALIFNVLVCNSDAHAKNYSIMIGAGGSTRLAPLYDLMCGAVWPRITTLLPQAIAGRREGVHLHRRDWEILAREVGLSPARTVRRVAELCAAVAGRAREARGLVAAMDAGDHPILEGVCTAVDKRCRRIERQLKMPSDAGHHHGDEHGGDDEDHDGERIGVGAAAS